MSEICYNSVLLKSMSWVVSSCKLLSNTMLEVLKCRAFARLHLRTRQSKERSLLCVTPQRVVPSPSPKWDCTLEDMHMRAWRAVVRSNFCIYLDPSFWYSSRGPVIHSSTWPEGRFPKLQFVFACALLSVSTPSWGHRFHIHWPSGAALTRLDRSHLDSTYARIFLSQEALPCRSSLSDLTYCRPTTLQERLLTIRSPFHLRSFDSDFFFFFSRTWITC